MTDYSILIAQFNALAEEDPCYIPLLSNTSALIYENLPDLNWAGFYLMREGRLVLGPFQGKVACIHIEVGKGVCGTAVKENVTQLVPDVHVFPGHIACDSASNSEIVIPLHCGGAPVAVLDIDSPLFGRFSEADEAGLKQVAAIMERMIVWEDNRTAL